MIEITYDTWIDIFNMYKELSSNIKKSYLQLFPFTKLTKIEENEMLSEEFYEKYIKNWSFILYDSAMFRSEHYLQKNDGSFRDSSLVSPMLFLILQSLGFEIYKEYKVSRPSDISVYYSGNYGLLRPHYKKEYDTFYKELNFSIDEYQYFIKTDITNFFSNINVDQLIFQIDRVCNLNEVKFSQADLQILKELLFYCGNGKFPLIENSIATSYLATIVYLDNIDKALHDYISTQIKCFSSFKFVRYVDDLYILINMSEPKNNLNEVYNEIIDEYSSILKQFGLSINRKKCYFSETKEINLELKKSLYDDYMYNEDVTIERIFSDNMNKFLENLLKELNLQSINVERYYDLIDTHFSSNEVEFLPIEVLNFYIYNNTLDESWVQNTKAIVLELIKKGSAFLNLDPKRLTLLTLKTKSESAIKLLLNNLFQKKKSNKWNSYDTIIALTYLIQRGFMHVDLLGVLSSEVPHIYKYYFEFCRKSFYTIFKSREITKIREMIGGDKKTYYLFFMYLCEINRLNYMVAYAYFKNYFDRITADFDSYINIKKKPNYNKFYTEKSLKKFYSIIDNSGVIISNAHKIRNNNPLSHASSELLDIKDNYQTLIQSMQNLKKLIFQYVDDLSNNAVMDRK
ncbi:AbiA family abortive infection protein [Enterococcus cecorum]|uniref:AbiA family abortive infection protein n=1 Tax=Enterococcus cecorum TaxID=44008 RepID=UPI0022D5598C|nr:AbiA family abortive infection protein [Enterococcus cecorum]CAI3259074.1 AbiA family abortive infection protein [Enterococcus cecorum]CAI3434405.1 AbiA family abortive infection protein [Enterococcus cecorum]CAI3438526.1 AbiA family abortive infection protein [Enterococcus cecorum]CAI3443399.1 AbiA family abortive infection protein [Enterococcus cecorum]CAI3460375.1 AbiA family abortive infection protein [Enterococcus cecorum]